MSKYFHEAKAIQKEIQKYCSYGAENRILRAEELLTQLAGVMGRAHRSTKKSSDAGLIHEIYLGMKELIAKTKGNQQS
jgi:hypothetical protein